jgi:hypothetical protein
MTSTVKVTAHPAEGLVVEVKGEGISVILKNEEEATFHVYPGHGLQVSEITSK